MLSTWPGTLQAQRLAVISITNTEKRKCTKMLTVDLWVAKFQVLLIFPFILFLFSKVSISMMESGRKLCYKKNM